MSPQAFDIVRAQFQLLLKGVDLLHGNAPDGNRTGRRGELHEAE
ncbi:hypothetical protein OP10G_1098 [Fimbriimonas ginsengisoli Gsoil 348]|uniref:Uncharacterized protein n=1 Tax=Fimbriimonas ginsengisoli Gsoil 348 TaxID=661478 RepID=A0A068NLW7_FIMGI|nr:hypothetical protein OP10G_1098 [Fimbriimonas ginsengisoli Gsoil 348]